MADELKLALEAFKARNDPKNDRETVGQLYASMAKTYDKVSIEI